MPKAHIDDRGRLRNPGRPWSLAEIEERGAPDIVERMEDTLTDLKRLGGRAASLKWELERHQAVARVRVRPEFAGTRSSAEDRDASAMLYTFGPEDFPGGTSEFVGLTVPDVGQAREIAGNEYDVQRSVLRALEAELDILRTLHVSGRQAP